MDRAPVLWTLACSLGPDGNACISFQDLDNTKYIKVISTGLCPDFLADPATWEYMMYALEYDR